MVNIVRISLVISLLIVAIPPVAHSEERQDVPNDACKKRDYKAELGKWQPLAEQGLSKAQLHLGQMYLYGHGVEKDEKVAFEWYRKAAEQGTSEAQLFLASRLDDRFKKLGRVEDGQEAVEWIRKVAIQGNADGLYRLAWHYEHGIVVARNLVLAKTMRILAGEKEVDPKYDELTRSLKLEQVLEAKRLAAEWSVGMPLPTQTKTWKPDG